MKQILMGAVLAALLVGAASASSLRIDGELLRAGSPVSDMTRLLGSPDHRSVVWVAGNPDHEVWHYRVNNLNYEFRVRAGRIESVQWSRF